MDNMVGTWALEHQEGFDDIMKHIGVGMVMRKMGNTLKPDFIVEKGEDGTWKMVTASTFKTTTAEFKEGVEFIEKTADDRDVKATITFEGDKMIHNQVDPNREENNTVIERSIEDGKLVTVVRCGGFVAKRVYTRKA